ncbi:MAG: ABC transporter transmembrane domain-containing protein, partial [Alphaproteobacteria bacterium]
MRIAGAAAVGLLSVLAGIARLALLGWLLGQVFEGRAAAGLALPVALVAAVMVLRGALEYWRAMIAHRTAAAVQLKIRERLYDAIARLGPAYFGQKRTGAAVVTMIDGVEQLETYFGRYLPQLFVAAVTPVAMFAVVAFLDLPVAALMCAFALFALLAPSLLQHWDRKSSLAHTKAHREFGSEFVDALQGLATLKAFGESRARGRLLAERAHALFRSTMWVLATSTLTRGVTDFGIVAGAAATLGLGTLRVAQGEMSLTALLIILMLGTEVFRPLRDLRAVMHAGMLGRSAAKGLAGILEARPVVADVGPDNDPEPSTLAPTIAFDDVTFSYPGGRRPAHEGLSFSVAAGERVGIVGPSGAGKSTILRLLQRLYDPQAGSVRIGGRDLRSLNLDQVRAQLAVVGQDTYLFHGTVEENLRVGKPEATAEELRAAARAANAEEFISRLPHGYGTVVGEKGIRLSGGQRQRVAIARALLRDAPILVLDEALSSVDAENEAVIQQALDRLIEGRTTLVLAHRLSSVISADRILALEDGRVAESGTHGELMAREGAYHRLMVSQAGRRGEETLGHDLADADPAPVVLDAESDREDDRAGGADDIVPAEGMGWIAATAALLRLIAPRRGQFTLTLFLGIARVFAFIGVGAISALTVAAVKAGAPTGWLLILLAVTAPVAAVLHWLESWTAHDMAYRLLSRLRIDLFEKLDRLAPAYLVRRRTGDLVGLATDDVERVEYFFAHTVAPAFVAVLVPAVVLGTLAVHGPALAVGLMPFLMVVGLSPFVMRRRVDALGSRAREALGELNAHAVDTIQGLDVILAFQHVRSRRDQFTRRIRAYHSVRLPFFRDLTLQTATVDVATGLGGLVVVVTGAMLVGAGTVDSGVLPLLTLLAMAAFLPVSEIAEVSRQLADTLGATRRLTAIHREPVAVTDGPGV